MNREERKKGEHTHTYNGKRSTLNALQYQYGRKVCRAPITRTHAENSKLVIKKL